MKIAVLGTGMVGQAVAGRLSELGHDVVVGTRDPEATLARTEPDGMGNPPFSTWHRAAPGRRPGHLRRRGGGRGSWSSTRPAGPPPSASSSRPGPTTSRARCSSTSPTHSTSRTASLPPSSSRTPTPWASRSSEPSRRRKVVKTLNTLNANLMVRPEGPRRRVHDLRLG